MLECEQRQRGLLGSPVTVLTPERSPGSEAGAFTQNRSARRFPARLLK